MIIKIKVRLNTVQQKNVYDNTNTNIISNLFSISSGQHFVVTVFVFSTINNDAALLSWDSLQFSITISSSGILNPE